MSERDELADKIEAVAPISAGDAESIADAILAAGYRKPRAITTAEELDALERGGIVRSDNGELWEKFANSWDNLSESGEHSYRTSEVALPATVFWEPS